jgi:hypothetical protein
MAIASMIVVIGTVITICVNYGVSEVDAYAITSTDVAIKLFIFLTP